jgi:hypothetical protein
MKKLVGLLVILGTMLLGGGVWWLLTNSEEIATVFQQPLKEVQEIGIDQTALAGQIVIDTPEGIQALNTATGELQPLSGSFERFKDQVLRLEQSSDGQYWLLQTRPRAAETTEVAEGEKPAPSVWYVVDWKNNRLQRLSEVFAKVDAYDTMELASIVWISNNMVGLAFNPIASSIPQSTLTPGGATPATQTALLPESYELAILNLETLQLSTVGTVKQPNVALVGGTVSVPELYFYTEQNDVAKVGRRQGTSSQITTILEDALLYIMPYNAQKNQVNRLTQSGMELLTLPQMELITTIPATDSYAMEDTASWSSNGEVLALTERQASEQIDTVNKQVRFFNNLGTELYALPVTNEGTVDGLSVLLSSTGQTALVQRNIQFVNSDVPEEERPTKIFYYVKVLEGKSEVISNIPATAQILGVF